jgi:hypothetical protein
VGEKRKTEDPMPAGAILLLDSSDGQTPLKGFYPLHVARSETVEKITVVAERRSLPMPETK